MEDCSILIVLLGGGYLHSLYSSFMFFIFLAFIPILIIVFKIAFSKKSYTNISNENNNSVPLILSPGSYPPILPYNKVNFLLTKAEFNFYKILLLTVNDFNLYVFPKVRLADIIYVTKTKSYRTYFNKIQSKHIDFLLCRDDFLIPVLAIELDDSSHYNQTRINRDLFLESALNTAGLPLLRIKVDYSYTVSELKSKIESILNIDKKTH